MNRAGMGAGGMCICLKCGRREAHQPGQPCRTRKCPACGAAMLREGGQHHQAYLQKRAAAVTGPKSAK